eukprot:1927365-Amphidinium_carterae.1
MKQNPKVGVRSLVSILQWKGGVCMSSRLLAQIDDAASPVGSNDDRDPMLACAVGVNDGKGAHRSNASVAPHHCDDCTGCDQLTNTTTNAPQTITTAPTRRTAITVEMSQHFRCDDVRGDRGL